MTRDSDESIADEIRANYDAQCDAMVAADVGELNDLLASEFTLTHMTGYLQPKSEWLDDIATGRMNYDSIRTLDVLIEITPDRVTLTARSRTHATIWGAEGTWRLQLRIDYVPSPAGWIATRTVASTW